MNSKYSLDALTLDAPVFILTVTSEKKENSSKLEQNAVPGGRLEPIGFAADKEQFSMQTRIRSSKLIRQIGICLLIGSLIAGCAGNYGRYKRDAEVLQSFKDNQVPSDYRYYYFGYDTSPYAVIGVEKKYDAGSNLWRDVEPNSEKFNKMIRWMWGDYGYSPFAARILDPSGNPVGVLYTSIQEVAIKFSGDNRIVVMPHTPFLWGPAVNGSHSGPYYGSTDLKSTPANFRQTTYH